MRKQWKDIVFGFKEMDRRDECLKRRLVKTSRRRNYKISDLDKSAVNKTAENKTYNDCEYISDHDLISRAGIEQPSPTLLFDLGEINISPTPTYCNVGYHSMFYQIFI